MINFDDKSPEKWNVQMCWRQTQQRSAPQTSSQSAWHMIVMTRGVKSCWRNGEDPEAIEEMVKALKTPARSVAHFAPEIIAE